MIESSTTAIILWIILEAFMNMLDKRVNEKKTGVDILSWQYPGFLHRDDFPMAPTVSHSCSDYQTYVATVPAGKVAGAHFPLYRILNEIAASPSFNAINTFLPSGVLKATL